MQDQPFGVLLLHKEAGMTSHDAVNKVRRLFSTKQVGHTGTLDPMATGVLPILVGRAVKASEYLLCDDKEYIAHLQLGRTTDTEDIWGKTLTLCEKLPSKEEVLAIKERFVGAILQVPPMYSALKVGGRKLCDLARENRTVERQAREIFVHSLDLSAIDEQAGLYRLLARVSKGTYIRTLCADIGKALGCGGVMASLCRTASGPFTLDRALTTSYLEALPKEQLFDCLLPIESLFEELCAVNLPDFYGRLCSAGCPVYLKKLGVCLEEGRMVRLYRNGVFFALGQVGQHPQGLAVKAVKQFVLFNDSQKGEASC